MEKALNLRLFTEPCDHPQWRSGYVNSGQLESTGFSNSTNDLLFPFFLFFSFLLCFVCLFVLLVFFGFFVLFLNIYLNDC